MISTEALIPGLYVESSPASILITVSYFTMFPVHHPDRLAIDAIVETSASMVSESRGNTSAHALLEAVHIGFVNPYLDLHLPEVGNL